MNANRNRVHMHNIKIAEDIVYDVNYKGKDGVSDQVKHSLTCLLNYARAYEDGKSGWSIPIGFIRRDINPQARYLFSLSDVESKIPADLYQWLVLIQDYLSQNGYDAEISDIFRFLAWFNHPESFAPWGDLLTGEYGWLPQVVHLFDFMSDDVIRFDEFISYFKGIPCEGRYCDRDWHAILTTRFNEQTTKDFLSKDGWTTSFEIKSTLVNGGDRLYCVFLKVLREVKEDKVTNVDATQ